MTSEVVGTLLLVAMTIAMPLTIIAVITHPTWVGAACDTTGVKAGAQLNLVTCTIPYCAGPAAQYRTRCHTPSPETRQIETSNNETKERDPMTNHTNPENLLATHCTGCYVQGRTHGLLIMAAFIIVYVVISLAI